MALPALTGLQDDTLLPQLAAAVAKRREIAGVHTHLDSAAGEALGTAIGKFMVTQATTGTDPLLGLWRALFAMASAEWAVKKL